MSRQEPINNRLAAPGGLASARTPRVLVVEDEILLRLDLAEELRAHGYAVIEAASADEAREILAARPEVDVVLTDVQMPGTMDGVALARLIGERWPAVKVVVISGAWRPGMNAPWLSAVLHKPVPSATIVRLVDRLTAPGADA